MVPPKKKVCAAPLTPAKTPLRATKSSNYSPISITSDDDSDPDNRDGKGRVSFLDRLRQDAFDDLKAGLRSEFEEIREKTDDTVYLRLTLKQWLDQAKAHRPTNHLYYRLDKTYPENDVPRRLEGRDKVIADALTKLQQEIPLEIFFAVLEREDTPRANTPPSYLVRRLIENGNELLVDIPVDDRNRLQPDFPPLNNSDSTFEAAIVLVARDSVADFLMEAGDGPSILTNRYHLEQKTVQKLACWYIDTKKPPNRPWNFPVRNMPVFRDICAKVWDLDKNKGLAILPHHYVDRILKAILEAKDFEFFEKAAAQTWGRVSSSFFYWLAGMVKLGNLTVKDIEKGVTATISTYQDAHHRCQAIAAFVELGDDDSKSLLQQLTMRALEAVDTHAPGTRDGEGLVSVVGVVLGPDAIRDRLGPVVERHIKQAPFVLGVLNGLRQLREHLPARFDIHTTYYTRLATQMIDALDICNLFYSPLEPEEEISSKLVDFTQPKPVPSGAVDADRLSEFVFSLVEDKAHNSLLRSLAFKVAAGAGAIRIKQFSLLWFPFLRKLSVRHTSFLAPRYQHMFAVILEAHFARCVGSISADSWAWRPNCPAVICPCRLCGIMKLFFESPTKAIRIEVPLHPLEVQHANEFYLTSTYDTHCHFTWENGSLVAVKLLTPGKEAKDAWLVKAAKAKETLVTVNIPGTRAILGVDAAELLDWDKPPYPENNTTPVPAEELMAGLPPVRVNFLLGRVLVKTSGHAIPPAPASYSLPAASAMLPAPVRAMVPPSMPAPANLYPTPMLTSQSLHPAPQGMHPLPTLAPAAYHPKPPGLYPVSGPAPAASYPVLHEPYRSGNQLYNSNPQGQPHGGYFSERHYRPQSPKIDNGVFPGNSQPPPSQQVAKCGRPSQTTGARSGHENQGSTQATTASTPIIDTLTMGDRVRKGYDYFVELLNVRLYGLGETARETWTRTTQATRRAWVDAAAQRANFRLGTRNKVEGAAALLAMHKCKELEMVEKVLAEVRARRTKERRKKSELIAAERAAARDNCKKDRLADRAERTAQKAEDKQKGKETQRAMAALFTHYERQVTARTDEVINETLKKLKAEADQRVQKAREALRAEDVRAVKTTPNPTRTLPSPFALGGRTDRPSVSTASSSQFATVTPASSRVLAPISASRINTPSIKLPRLTAVKTEPSARPSYSTPRGVQSSTPRGVKRKVAEVIDLTLDDD